MDGDEMVLIPEGVETIKKVFEYSLLEGDGAVAMRLNAEVSPPSPKVEVDTINRQETSIDSRGAITTNQAFQRGVQAREKMKAIGKEEQIPRSAAALSKEEVDKVLGKRTTCTAAGSENGRRGKLELPVDSPLQLWRSSFAVNSLQSHAKART